MPATATRFRPALVLLLVVFGLGVSPGLDGRQRTEAGRLLLDLRALDAGGRPVLDLRAEDMRVKVNGQERAVRSLELLRFGREPGTAEPAPPPPSVPAPFATNEFAVMGRDVYLVFEDESISPSNDDAPRAAALRLVEALEPRDRVAVMTIPRGGVDQGLTSDRERIRAALAKRLGRAARAETADDASCRTRRTFEELTQVFNSIWSGPSSTIVLFSSGVTPPTMELSTISDTRLGGTQTLCPVRMEDYQDLGRAFRASRAAFYVVYLIDGAINRSSAGLESVAGIGDNRMFHLGRSNLDVLAPIAAETAASYVLTFDVGPSDQEGKALRVDVRTTRDGVKLQSPTELIVPDRRGRMGPRVEASNAGEMVRTGQPYLDLPLRAVSYASRNAGDDRVKLVVLFEAADPNARLASAATAAFDERGALKAQSTSGKDDLGVSPVMAVLAVPQGAYRVRVAATDASGRGGTVDLEADVALEPAGPFKLSTLVLGAAGAASFQPRLQFQSEPAAVGYLEIYGRPGKAEVAVTFELMAPDGNRVIARGPAVLRSTSLDDLRLAMVDLPIASLPPGDYLVRAIVSVDGKEMGRTDRTLRKK